MISPSTCEFLSVRRGKIPAIQIGGRWRMKKNALNREVLRQDKARPTNSVTGRRRSGRAGFSFKLFRENRLQSVVIDTAKEAINRLRKQKFDLLFLDLQLPDSPGDQVNQTAKQIDPDFSVIVITGYPDSEILDRILQVCSVTVLQKPLKIRPGTRATKFEASGGVVTWPLR